MTITKEHLRDMFEFVRWADGQMLTAARAVPEEGYYKDQGISIGSIHKLLVHCMAAQWVWLSRWRGESPGRLENHEDYPTRDVLEQRWPLVHSAILDFLGLQSPRSLAREVQYKNTRGETFSIPLGVSAMRGGPVPVRGRRKIPFETIAPSARLSSSGISVP